MRYILYGTGMEGEKFLFQNLNLLQEFDFCIDAAHTGVFHGLPIYRIEEAPALAGRLIIVATGEWSTYEEIRKGLLNRGCREFKDFLYSRAFGKKLLLINANCHGAAIVQYLELSRKFRDRYFAYPLSPVHLNEAGEIAPDLLHYTDVYIHQDIQTDNPIGYKVSDDYVLPRLRKSCIRICMPNFVGMGNWMYPSLGGLEKVVHAANGPLYVLYRDRVLDEAAEKGLRTIGAYKKFWTEYRYSPGILNQIWEKDRKKLYMRERNWDIPVADYIYSHYQEIPCYTDANHPSKYIMRMVCRKIAKLFEPELDDIEDSSWEPKPQLGIAIPVLPAVKEYYGLSFRLPQERKEDYLGRRTEAEPDDYIRAYLWWYHEMILDEA